MAFREYLIRLADACMFILAVHASLMINILIHQEKAQYFPDETLTQMELVQHSFFPFFGVEIVSVPLTSLAAPMPILTVIVLVACIAGAIWALMVNSPSAKAKRTRILGFSFVGWLVGTILTLYTTRILLPILIIVVPAIYIGALVGRVTQSK